MRNKRGRVVSRRRHAIGKQRFKANGLDKWLGFARNSYQELKLSGFVKMKKPTNGAAAVEGQFYRRTLEKWVSTAVERMNRQLQATGSKVRCNVQPEATTPLNLVLDLTRR